MGARATLLLSCLLLTFGAHAAERMSCVVLPFRNLAGTNDDHWRRTVSSLIASQLRELRDIRVVADGFFDFSPDPAIALAWRENAPDGNFDRNTARAVGRTLQADRVVWASCDHRDSSYRLFLQILNVAGGRDSPVLDEDGADWTEIIRKIRARIFAELAIHPTTDETNRMDSYLPKSSAILERLSRALQEKAAGEPIPKAEAELRQAHALDPEFGPALEALAQTLTVENRVDEAVHLAKQAVELSPQSARAHYTLGTAFLVEGLKTLARDELLQAHKLDPDSPEILVRLGQLSRLTGQWDQATAFFAKAMELQPLMALPHAEMAHACIARGDAERASKQLRLAEQYNPGNDYQLIFILSQVYAALHDIPKAVTDFEAFLNGAQKYGFQMADVELAQSSLADLKPLLIPHVVETSKLLLPKAFGPGQLQAALSAKLSPKERALVQDPFEASPEMEECATRLVGNATNDILKAQRLFEGIIRRIGAGTNAQELTARQAFKVWRDGTARLSCQDYTFLLVAMARSVHLKAHYALVNRDCHAKAVPHACAAFVLGDKGLLVDPTYLWFGAPHQNYQLQDDLHAQALFMAQSSDPEMRLAAAKLVPDFALVRFILASSLAASRDRDTARAQLQAGLALDDSGWIPSFARGVVEFYEGHGVLAIEDLQKCERSNVDFPEFRYYLAAAMASTGRGQDAQAELERYLQDNPDSEGTPYLRRLLADIRIASPGNAIHDGQGALWPNPGHLFSRTWDAIQHRSP